MSDSYAAVSHELRMPLTSLHGSLKLLSVGQFDSRSDKGQQLLRIANEGTERLVGLIDTVLDLQRIQSDRVELNLQTCDTADLMSRAIQAMQGMARYHRVTLSTSLTSILIQANPDHIVQILTHLLSNGIKFSPCGETVWLTAEVRSSASGVRHPVPEVRESKIASLSSKGSSLHPSHPISYALFSVRDRGEGIPADELERIFERFHQVDASDSRKWGGTGSGLAIAREIVEQHGGVIWAESRLGEGSIFYFTIPIASKLSG